MFRVHLLGIDDPIWKSYSGHVDVAAENMASAKDAALKKINKSALGGRPDSLWIVEGIEEL